MTVFLEHNWNDLVGVWNPKGSYLEPETTSPEHEAALDPAQPPRASMVKVMQPIGGPGIPAGKFGSSWVLPVLGELGIALN